MGFGFLGALGGGEAPSPPRHGVRGTPARCASSRSAVGKSSLCVSITKSMALPPAPQLKHLKNGSPLWVTTARDGFRSSWNGHRPTHSRPRFVSFTRSPTISTRSVAAITRSRSRPPAPSCIAAPILGEPPAELRHALSNVRVQREALADPPACRGGRGLGRLRGETAPGAAAHLGRHLGPWHACIVGPAGGSHRRRPLLASM